MSSIKLIVQARPLPGFSTLWIMKSTNGFWPPLPARKDYRNDPDGEIVDILVGDEPFGNFCFVAQPEESHPWFGLREGVQLDFLWSTAINQDKLAKLLRSKTKDFVIHKSNWYADPDTSEALQAYALEFTIKQMLKSCAALDYLKATSDGAIEKALKP